MHRLPVTPSGTNIAFNIVKSSIRLLPWILLALLLIGLAVSWNSGGIVYHLAGPGLTGEERVSRLKQFFEQAGMLAPVVYVMFVTIEVVIAPIPGLFLYAPGGLIFGPWIGGLLAIIGNVLGAGIACGLVRYFGEKVLRRIASGEIMERLQTHLEQRGF